MTTGERKALFASHEETAALVALFRGAGTSFDEASAMKPPEDHSAELAEQAAQFDSAYDRDLGLTESLLRAFELYYQRRGEVDRAAAIATAADRLLPLGRMHIRQTYEGEAGHAMHTRTLLADDAALSALLAEMTLPQGDTVLDVVQSWIDAGVSLGAVEGKRQDVAQAASPSQAQLVVDARRQWIRVARHAQGAVALTESLTDEQREFLLRPLAAAAAKAAAAKKSPNPEADPKTPEPGFDGGVTE